MASKRALRFLAPRTPALAVRASSTVPRRQFSHVRARSQVSLVTRNIARVQTGLTEQRRWHSGIGEKSKMYEFEDVLNILENPSSSTVLIDVREPAEHEANSIPTSINIPITSQPDSLLLPPDEFEDRFGFQKPPTNKEVVFFCKAGVRSSAAAQLAKQAGYENVGEYRGSWLDWERRGGPGTRSPPPPGGKGEPNESEIKE